MVVEGLVQWPGVVSIETPRDEYDTLALGPGPPLRVYKQVSAARLPLGTSTAVPAHPRGTGHAEGPAPARR